MSRNKTKSSNNTMIFLLVVATYYLIKLTIEIIYKIIDEIVKLVIWILNKNQNKPTKNNKKTSIDTELKERLITQLETNQEKPNIFDKNIYDNLFPVQIRNRGEKYYLEDKIKYFKKNDNNYSCIVRGTKNYNVKLKIENNNIISSNCTCPYYSEEKQNCKHIYALLYKIKCSENKEKIISSINNQISNIKTIIKIATDYINKNKTHFSHHTIEEFNNYSKQYISQTSYYEKNYTEKLLEDTLLKNLNSLLNIKLELKEKIKKTLTEENINQVTSASKPEQKNKVNFTEAVSGIIIANEIDKHFSEEDDEELEAKMETYNLENWQKNLVREKRYNPWNFEEEELEEDDYYYEDDK